MSSTFYIPYRSKKHACTIKAAKEKDVSLVTCEMAGLNNQEFADSDIPGLIADLPNIIKAIQEHRQKNKDSLLQVRLSPEDRTKIEQRAKNSGKTISAYIRTKALA